MPVNLLGCWKSVFTDIEMSTKRITRTLTGHRCGASHQKAKLTTEQVKEMRSLREKTGASYAALASKFGCGQSTARDIVNYWTRVSS